MLRLQEGDPLDLYFRKDNHVLKDLFSGDPIKAAQLQSSINNWSTTTDSSPPTTEVRNNPSPSSFVYRGETTGLLVQADTAESYC